MARTSNGGSFVFKVLFYSRKYREWKINLAGKSVIGLSSSKTRFSAILTQDHVPTLKLVSKKLKVCLVNVVESLDICIWNILEIKLGDLCGCEVVSVIGIPEVFPVVLVPTVGLDKVAPTLQIQKSSLLILQMLQFYHIVVLNRALQSVPGIHCRIFSDLPKMV